MKHVRKILVPTDFSASAANAFVFAQKLAKKFGASLKVINVYRADFGMPVPETMAYQMLEARKVEALKKMETFLKKADISLKIESLVEMGFPSDMIVDYTKTKEEKIDLVVMGTKGEHNLAERILGSVSTAVIRDAECPVIAVPENCTEFEIKLIAYASDLKSDMADSIGEAAKIAKFFKAVLRCVYIDTNGDSNGAKKQRFKDLISELGIDTHLTDLKSDTLEHGLDTYIHEEGIDMLLMYRPHRTFFDKIFHNSATKKVALHSTVPLLVFKHH
jgi:nucleotide-binding universal stress UspA family protein